MSSAAAEAKRRDALAALKLKKLDVTRPAPTSTNGSASPESLPSAVLVPPSSSPAGPSHPSIRFSGFAHPAPRSNGSLSSNLLASSHLNGNPSSSSSSTPLGSPMSVLSSIQNRRTAEDQKRTTGPSSLSYESTSDPSRPVSHNVSSSPTSPAPLSRLKRRYEDDTPTKSSPGTDASRSVSRTPSLIAAAHQQQDLDREKMVDRLSNQFRNVSKDQIRQSVRKYHSDPDKAINFIEFIDSKGSAGSVLSSPDPLAVPVRRPFQPPSSPSRPHSTSTSYSSIPITAHHPGPPPKPPKPKKNEKSAIYANRANGKKRDPDEESSVDGGSSDGESEIDWSGDEGRRRKKRKGDPEIDAEGEALKAFNETSADMLTGTIACSAEQAAKIITLRPFDNVEQARSKLTKARGVSFKLFEQYTEIMEGYVQIDVCLNRCETIAEDVAHTQAIWRGASLAADSTVGTPRADGLNDVKVDVARVSELLRQEVDPRKKKILASYIQKQPKILSEGTELKDYQLLGVNWLNLLYSKKIGCILADEMGLGKTIQVIAFLAHLQEKGINGPHMIFVPASTLENWIREFDRFCPEIDVQTYYGSQQERAALRDDIKRMYRSNKLRVVLASYTQVVSHDDLNFFRKKVQFETCIYDEGHRLKNCMTKAYNDLLSIKPKWRLLLTGTPLQNNLQELVSLLIFIHKDIFTDAEPYLRAIFKSQGQASLLSQQRVSRARTMLTPFVLRRRKAHVLDLPPKTERVEHCAMTPAQAKLYNETMQRSKRALEELNDEELDAAIIADEGQVTKKAVANGNAKAKKNVKAVKGPRGASSANVLMDLRKAASHPLLFRRLYTDAKVRKLAKACLSTPKWCEAGFDFVVEDLEVMSDAEISHFCTESEFNELRKHALEPKVFLEGGKVAALRKHIERCQSEGKRMLLFSQFVMILDILEVALEHLGIRYTRLDGSTRTDERQGLVDEFNDDPDITIFLLSTKAGGVGINLTAASVVIIYDQDFNPHNDRQAADRAYRIGQEKEVEVIKLITKGSIDEDMLNIGATKLQLDDAVGGEEITLDGEAGPAKDDMVAKEVRKSLLTTLRNKFDAGSDATQANGDTKLEAVKEEEPDIPTIKKARPSLASSQTVEDAPVHGGVTQINKSDPESDLTQDSDSSLSDSDKENVSVKRVRSEVVPMAA